MTRWTTFALGMGVLVCFAGNAYAQDSTSPPPSQPPAAAYSSPSSGGGHGMIGVGGIVYMGGTSGLSFAYDPGPWHIDALIGYSGVNDSSTFNIGGRFWYHVKSSANADLSVGAGGSLVHNSPAGPGGSTDSVLIEAGALIRVFLAPSVALSAGSGLVVGAADADGFYLGTPEQTVGLVTNAGLHYFF
jgi:hypothetical protein